MKFKDIKDEFHFKNYVRKVAESCGYDKFEFEKTKIPMLLIDAYLFQIKYETEIFAVGAPNIIDHFIGKLKKLYYQNESQKGNIFF